MKKTKMNLADMQGKLSRMEMRNIMAGDAPSDKTCNCNSADDCTATNEMCLNSCEGKPGDKYQGKCGCS